VNIHMTARNSCQARRVNVKMQAFDSIGQPATSQRKIMANRIHNLTLTPRAHAACGMRAGLAIGIEISVLLWPTPVGAVATQ
jgi:hypothetical protein